MSILCYNIKCVAFVGDQVKVVAGYDNTRITVYHRDTEGQVNTRAITLNTGETTSFDVLSANTYKIESTQPILVAQVKFVTLLSPHTRHSPNALGKTGLYLYLNSGGPRFVVGKVENSPSFFVTGGETNEFPSSKLTYSDLTASQCIFLAIIQLALSCLILTHSGTRKQKTTMQMFRQ